MKKRLFEVMRLIFSNIINYRFSNVFSINKGSGSLFYVGTMPFFFFNYHFVHIRAKLHVIT